MDAPLTASDGGAASSSTVPHATVSRSRRQHCGCLPVFNDFLQDRVRSRTIAALVPVFLFCLVVFGILRDFPDESDVVATVEFSSSPPVGAFFGFSLVRAPRVQVLTESQRGLEGVEATVSVKSVIMLSTRNTIDCSTSTLTSYGKTLEAARVRTICTPVLLGTVNTSTQLGLASFFQLGFQRGPPGLYALQFSAADHSTEANVQVFSNVFTMFDTFESLGVESGPPANVPVGTPIPAQPQLVVVNKRGKPIAGKEVLVFVGKGPYFFSKSRIVESNLRGQQFATLSGDVSLPSNELGIAKFQALTVEGATSPIIYMYFYTEGNTFCWTSPDDRPSSVEIPAVPSFVPGLTLETTVAALSVVTQPSATVVEGQPFATPPRIRVTDENGNGIAGKRVYAIMYSANGYVLPNLYYPNSPRASLKHLENAVSGTTDANGEVTMTDLQFSVAGTTSGSREFKIKYVCDGVYGPLSTVTVSTSVQEVQLRLVPVNVPVLTGSTALNSESASQVAASVRVLGVNKAPLVGKFVKPVLVYSSGTAVNAQFAAASISYDAPEGVPLTTGVDGLASVPLVLNYLRNSSAFNASDIRLRFDVDGVSSVVSNRIIGVQRSLPSTTAPPCVYLRTVTPPPASVVVNQTFSVQLMAVDAQGLPCAGARARVAFLGEVFDFFPFQQQVFKFVPSGPTGYPEAVSGADGLVTIHMAMASAPVAGTASLVVVGPGTASSLSPANYYSDSFRVQVVNPVQQVLVGSHANTVAFIQAGEFPANLTMQVPIRILDGDGNGVKGVTVSTKMLGVPGCMSYFTYNDGNPQASTLSGDQLVTPYGDGQNTYATLTQPATGSDPNGFLTITMQVGQSYPGLYAAVFDAFGVRSVVAVVYWLSPVASIEIVRQPATWAPGDSEDGDQVTMLGNAFLTQPAVRLLDADGDPVEGMFVNAAFGTDGLLAGVTEDTAEAPVLPDLVRDPIHNLLGTRLSEPSDANGVARFTQLGPFDGLTGCYRVAFFHLYADPDFKVVFSDASQPVCVRNADTYSIHSQPSKVTSNGSPFVTGVGTSVQRDYVSTFDAAGIVARLAMVDRYINVFRSPHPEVYSPLYEGNYVYGSNLLTPLYLDNNVCVYFGATVVEGDCTALQRTSAVTAEGDTVYTSTFTMNGIAWDNALPGDELTLRIFGPLVLSAARQYNFVRQDRVVGGCSGVTGQGTFGMCCASDAQCNTGAGFTCDTANRVCTQTCTANTQCPVPPNGDLGTLTGSGQKFGVCNAATGGSSTRYCAANSFVAWSMAPYCLTCNLANYSGEAGPPTLTAKTLSGLEQLLGSMEAACMVLGIMPRCDEITEAVTGVVEKVIELCLSPALEAVCNGGFTQAAAQNALLTIIEAKVKGQPLQKIISVGVKAVFSQEPGRLPGRSEPTHHITMQAQPALVSIAVQPPESIVVGQLFSVEVFVGVASGAPVRLVKVAAQLTDITTTTLTETVESFIGKVSGDSPDPSSEWTKASLDTSRAIATTDRYGIARFQLRIDAAMPGDYALVFYANNAVSSKSVTISVRNPVHKVEISTSVAKSVKVDSVPATINMPAITVAARDEGGYPVTGQAFKVYVSRVVETDSVVNNSKSFFDKFDSMSDLDRAKTVFSLLVQGGRQLNILPQPAPAAVVAITQPPTLQGDGTYLYPEGAIKITAQKFGTIRLVFVTGAIASTTGSAAPQLEVTAVDTTSFEYKVVVALTKVALFLLGGLVWMGNSQWHSPWWMIVSLVVTIATMVAVIFISKSNNAQLVALETSLALIAIAYGVVLLLRYTKGAARMHYATKADAMVEYTKRLVNGRRIHGGPTANHRSSTSGGESGVELAPVGKSAAAKQRSVKAAASKKRKSKASGLTELQRQLEYDRRAEAADAHRRSYITNFKAMVASIRSGTNPDAFFFPARMQAALAVSLVANTIIVYTSVSYFADIRFAVERLDAQALRTVFTALSSMEALFNSRFSSDLFSSEVEFGYQQAAVLHAQFVGMGDAIYAAFITGLVVACLGYFTAWLVLVLDLRAQVLSARVGSFNFNKSKVKVADASNYFGIQISNSIMTYALLIIAVSLGAFPVYWSVSRNLILGQWKLILALVLPAILNVVAKKVFGYHISTTAAPYDHIRFRRVYHVYDLVQMFLQLYTGIMTAIVRFITVVGISLASLPRLDRSPMPAWVERYTLLDTGSKSYESMIMQVHEFSNPVATSATNLLVHGGVAFRAQCGDNKAGTTARVAKSRRARTRWHLAFTLLNNPELRRYRKDKSKARPKQTGGKGGGKGGGKSGGKGGGKGGGRQSQGNVTVNPMMEARGSAPVTA